MNKKNVILNCLNYAMFGDIIGYQNGNLKYNKSFDGILTKKNNEHDYIELSSIQCNYMLFKYVNNNLFNGLVYENEYYNYIPSANTVIHLIIAEELIKNFNKNYIDNIKKKIINYYKNDKLKKKRDYNKYIIKNLTNTSNIHDNTQNLSDSACYTMIIGIIFNDYFKIIDISFNIGLLFNKNGIGILGCITSSLFTNFAYNDIKISEWIIILLKLLKSDELKEKFKFNKKYLIDLEIFINSWNKYYLLKFNNKKYIDYSIAFGEPSNRYEFYFNNFSSNKKQFFPGNYADDCLIIVYDLLIESKLDTTINKNFSQLEKLVIKSILHTGNSNNIATILFSIYGLKNEKDTKYINKIIFNKNNYNKVINNIIL